jgi:ABC-type transport system involved in multi-copper enzyme maturation permease subunit
MSATTVAPLGQIDVSGTPRTPFGRLVKVELRKMFDTRAGLWLGLITAFLILLALAIPQLVVALNDSLTISANVFLTQIMTIPLSLLMPVFAIIAVTSEWGQRTGLVTFALEPHRGRIIAAKLVTVVVLAALTITLAVGLALGGTAVAGLVGDYSPTWNLELETVAWVFVQQLLFFVMAFAFGLLFLNTAGAVAVYYVVALLLPLMVFGPLFAIFTWAQDVIPWIDLGFALMPFSLGEGGGWRDVAHVAVTSTIWVIIPLTLGLRRVLRAEVK